MEKSIKILRENTKWISIILSGGIILIGFFFNFLAYTYEIGFADYYNIPHNNIEAPSETSTYSIIYYLLLAIVFITFSSIPFFVYTYDIHYSISLKHHLKDMVKRAIIMILFYLVLILVLIFNFVIPEKYSFIQRINILFSLIFETPLWPYLGLLVLVIVSIPFICSLSKLYSVFQKHEKKGEKKKSRRKKRKKIKWDSVKKIRKERKNRTNNKSLLYNNAFKIFLFISLISCIVMIVWTVYFGYKWGNARASELNDYRILSMEHYNNFNNMKSNEKISDNKYAIIYDTSDYYIITKCKIEQSQNKVKLKIENINEQQLIQKENIIYTVTQFNEVSIS